MNQSNNSAVRGIVIGLGAVAAVIWPVHQVQIAEAAAGLYSVLAMLKPFLPHQLGDQV